MTSREFDLLCIDSFVMACIFVWVGYQLRRRVERWEARHVTHRSSPREPTPLPARVVAGKAAPRPKLYRARHPKHIPIARRNVEIPVVGVPTTPDLSADVVAALVGAGYKRAEAVTAVSACTAEERAGGLEQWTVAALRRATTRS